MSQAARILQSTGRLALALMFLFTGGSKLLGNPMMVAMFDKIGFGQGFRYVTGALELLTAVLLTVPRTSLYGALLGGCVIIGAFLTQWLVLHGDVIHTIVIALVIAAVMWQQQTAKSTVS